MGLAVLAIALTGLEVYRQGLQDIRRLHLGVHALMAVAVTGAFLIGQWPEAAMVMVLYVAAERIEEQAVGRARQALGQLLALSPDTALVQQADGSYHSQASTSVSAGAVVRVAPAAHIPLDGVIIQGQSSLNQAPITGESLPVAKAEGDQVWAGSINLEGELLVQVSHNSSNSLLARIVRSVEQAQERKAPVQRWVDKFARIYTPSVMLLALALALSAPLLWGWSWSQATYQALALLVIACPCALVLSTPVSIVSALAVAARRGILLKGGEVLEVARQIQHIALDKTGTLTSGQPQLQEWATCNEQQVATLQGFSPAQWAQAVASRSLHPVAQAIAQGLAEPLSPQLLALLGKAQMQALPGRGMVLSLQHSEEQQPAEHWYLCNWRWVEEQGLAQPDLAQAVAAQAALGRSVSLLATSKAVIAWFAIADSLRPQAQQAITQLQQLGVHAYILSGDQPQSVQALAKSLGIASKHALGGLLPQNKLEQLQALQHSGPTAMVGDGINDGPALAQADLGFAMGGMHSTSLAMETADIVLTEDNLLRLPETIALSRRTYHILWQNISLALGIKAAFFALALSGHASMWLAVVADMGVSLLVVGNSLRLRRWKGIV